jgi:hypothetical protein
MAPSRPRALQALDAGKDLSFVPVRPQQAVKVRHDHMKGDRFRHTTQFVRWRPDRPALLHLRRTRPARPLQPRGRARHQRPPKESRLRSDRLRASRAGEGCHFTDRRVQPYGPLDRRRPHDWPDLQNDRRIWRVRGQLDGRCGRSGPVGRFGSRRGAGAGVKGRVGRRVGRRLGECRSGRAAVFVDQPAKDVDAFDACVRIGARLERSSGDRDLEVDAAVKGEPCCSAADRW